MRRTDWAVGTCGAKLYRDAWLREAGILAADELVTDYDWRATEPSPVPADT